MLKKYLLFILFAATANVKSQTYSPFVVDSAIWIIQSDDYAATPWVDLYYGHYMQGDSTYNGFSYKKIYGLTFQNTAPSWPQPFQVTTIGLSALIRESSKKIFCIIPSGSIGDGCPVNTEFLLYDFNYEIGDTVNLCIQYEDQDTISSISINSAYNRKNFITGPTMNEYIEGVGSSMGLFSMVHGPTVSGGMIPSLHSYCQGTLTECNLLTNVESYSISKKISIYPNPCKNISNIEVPQEYIGGTIKIYDSQGRLLKIKKIDGTHQKFSFNLNQGIYYIECNQNNLNPINNSLIILN